MNQNSNFIMTTSKDTADYLIKAEYILVQNTDKMWFFVNKPGKLVYDNLKEIRYTNKLFI